jgi:hypothetical protein
MDSSRSGGSRWVQAAVAFGVLPAFVGISHIVRLVRFGAFEPLVSVYLVYACASLALIVGLLRRSTVAWWFAVILAAAGTLGGAFLMHWFVARTLQLQHVEWNAAALQFAAFHVLFPASYSCALVLLLLPGARRELRSSRTMNAAAR